VSTVDAPSRDVDFSDPGLIQDPFPILDDIREAGPVVYNPRIERWMVTSYRNVKEVIGNDKRFAPDAEQFVTVYGADVMESVDNPRHNEIRGIWNPAFRRGTLEASRQMISEVIEQCVNAVTERLLDGEVVDLVPTMNREVPALILARQLGVPADDIWDFLTWSDGMTKTLEALYEPDSERAASLQREGTEATAATCSYAAKQLERRRHGEDQDSDDLIGMLALSPVAETMSEAEQRAAITQLVVAGQNTTAHTISFMLVALGEHPDQRRAIVEDRSLIPQAVEEVLRFRLPSLGNTRFAREEVTLEGATIPHGAGLLGLMAAANRDSERWEYPNRFDIFRPSKQHLGFGVGLHVCLGLHLARIEMQILLETVLERMANYELVDEKIDYVGNFVVYGPKAVRVSL
jgi:cytochrome P450